MGSDASPKTEAIQHPADAETVRRIREYLEFKAKIAAHEARLPEKIKEERRQSAERSKRWRKKRKEEKAQSPSSESQAASENSS